MTEVSVETCITDLKVLSLSLNSWLAANIKTLWKYYSESAKFWPTSLKTSQINQTRLIKSANEV